MYFFFFFTHRWIWWYLLMWLLLEFFIASLMHLNQVKLTSLPRLPIAWILWFLFQIRISLPVYHVDIYYFRHRCAASWVGQRWCCYCWYGRSHQALGNWTWTSAALTHGMEKHDWTRWQTYAGTTWIILPLKGAYSGINWVHEYAPLSGKTLVVKTSSPTTQI